MSGAYTVTTIPRRYITFAALAFFLLVLIYQFNDNTPFSVRPVSTEKPYVRPPKVDDGRFHWQNREQHYPLTSLTPVPSNAPKSLPAVQHIFGQESSEAKQVRLQRRGEIKKVFEKCWKSYRERAWMRDELSPISGTGRDTFGGWAATLVDSLDTLWIMDLKNEFQEATSAVQHIDFGQSTDTIINIFETTIRYLGGFLGAYDLSGNKKLLDLAVEVGEMLLVAFDTPNHLPITRWDWKAAARGDRQDTPSSILVSEIGSLSLEFTRLSQLTGDQRFYDAIKRITTLFDKQQSQTKLPGMWPVIVNPKAEDMTSDTGFTLGGMSDSLYEYLPKEYALLGGQEPVYQKMYEQSMKTAIESLFFRPMTPKEDDILISGDARASADGRSSTLEPKGQHLGCFAGGMLGLGGRLFQNNEHLALARKLTEGCIWAYHAMDRGIMPEVAHFVPCEDKANCPWVESKWLQGVLEKNSASPESTASNTAKQLHLAKGYTKIDDKRYILRPEAIESVFYMWRITGEGKYREAAWQMWTAISEVTKSEFANAAIVDITVPEPVDVPKDDRMESFWFAETLKYFYLIFSEPGLVSLDDYVLNTEAHPLRRYK